MAKNSKRRLLFTSIMLAAVLICSAYAALIPKVHAAEMTTQQKGLSIFNDVIGLNTTKYATTPKEYPKDLYKGVLLQEIVDYNLESSESKLKLSCTFVDGTLQMINVLELEGSPYITKPATNVLEMAQDFISNYQTTSKDSLYGDLRLMLDNVDTSKNSTETSGNAKLEVTATQYSTTFRWTYTFNGVEAGSKCVVLAFENGFLKYFIDNWRLYEIGSTDINLSEKEAISIAMDAAKTYSWKVWNGSDAEGKDMWMEVNDFKILKADGTLLYFGDSLIADKARSENLLAMYPVWRVGILLDKFYPGDVYGITVDIWADTKEVRYIREAYTTMDLPSGETEQNSMPGMWIALPALVALLGVAPVLLRSIRPSPKSCNLPKLRSFKIGAMLCLIILFSIFLGPIALAKADIPEPNGRIAFYSCSRDKTQCELDLQESACEVLDTYFEWGSVGYVADNYQGSTQKSLVLSNAEAMEDDFHRAAVVVFDHGVGRDDYPQAPNEFHYLFEDNEGAVPSIENPDFNNLVFDMDIYPKTELGKHFFVLINTCQSANTIGHMGTYGAVGMPYAWTHTTYLNSEGYFEPDSGSHCFIGFQECSAALALTLPDEQHPDVFYYNWLTTFFNRALFYDRTIKQALNDASNVYFDKTFGETVLHSFNGFYGAWPPAYPERIYWGRMRVYGNANLHLDQHSLTVLAKDQYNNEFANKDVYIDTCYNIANTGATMKITGGSHTFWANDFWETSGGQCTGNRYYFDHYDDGLGWSSSEYHATRDFPTDLTITAHFNKEYHPGDADGDKDVDSDDYYYLLSHYPSTRGDSTYKYDSACDFNSDGDVDDDDKDYLEGILGLFEVYVPCYNQYGYPGYNIPVYIDGHFAGYTFSSLTVTAGTHTIQMPSALWDWWGEHYFACYYYDGIYNCSNPLTLVITSDKTVTAYYVSYYYH